MPKIYIQLKDLPWSKAGIEWEEQRTGVETKTLKRVDNILPEHFPLSTFHEWFKEKKEERWRAGFGGQYYCIVPRGVGSFNEANNETDNQRYSTGNYFQTIEEAERCYQEYILPDFKKYWEGRGMEV